MRSFLSLVLLCVISCGDPSELLLGTPIDQSPFDPIDQTAGIHPSLSVLTDPANLYRNRPPTEDAKWDVQSLGDPKLAYYAFASALTRVPTGENQYYVGINLKRLSDLNLVVPGKERMVRDMAIKAFETVIQQFPNDLTYEADGETSYNVADFARDQLSQF